jgi:hypothetical protein
MRTKDAHCEHIKVSFTQVEGAKVITKYSELRVWRFTCNDCGAKWLKFERDLPVSSYPDSEFSKKRFVWEKKKG